MRRAASALVLAAMLHVDLLAHAALRFSSPLEGVALGDAPAQIQLTFTERPDAALSEIHVVDRSGVAYDEGRLSLVSGDPLSIAVIVRRLPTGIYTVNWRVVSAIDGHAATGSYAFGVRQSPAGIAATVATPVSILEVAARWVLDIGLVMLIGAVSGVLLRFALGPAVSLAIAGWILSCTGLGLLVWAETRAAGPSLRMLLGSSVGRMLLWRFAALAAAAAALGVARRTLNERTRAGALLATLLAALVTVAIQALAGHAAAGPALPAVEIVAQWAHVAASGIWIGGLAVLLVGVRGAASDEKALAVSRFSLVALVAILIVIGTGAVRALGELTAWSDLTRTVYGRTLLAKIALVVAIAMLGAANRLRSVPAAHRDLSLLRRFGGGELTLAGAALGAAGLLAALAPPATARIIPGILASATDFATTTSVSFSAVSNQPGPNRFLATVVDYDSRAPITGALVRLRFAPVDDPQVAATSLALTETGPGEYSASGANLAFDGRWRVTVDIQRGANTVQVSLDAAVAQPPLPVETRRAQGVLNYYAMARGGGFVRFSLEPQRAGPSRLSVGIFDVIQDERGVDYIVVTQAAGRNPPRVLRYKRLSAGRFVADVDLASGLNTFTAVAYSPENTRVRASVEIDVPQQ